MKRILKNQNGFALPAVLSMIIVLSLIAYAVLLQANNGLNIAYKQGYLQMARIASKSAVDFAQEQFDNNLCGTYTGTAEQNIVQNSRYRVTMKTDVISTSADGFEKTIKGTGAVYLPRDSATARYVFDVRSEILRTYAVCKAPLDFSPTVWLDASDLNSLKRADVATTNATPITSYGNASDSTRDTLEERVDNGQTTLASWQSNDFDMHTCRTSEFPGSICTNNTTRYLNNGMIFSNVNIPKNSNISSATITLACTTPAGQSGSLTHNIYSFYKSSTNPHPDLFTQTGSNQLKTPLATPNLHSTAFSTASSNNCPPGNNTVFDVTTAVQEAINHPGWSPTTPGNGGRLGIAFTRSSGSGSRHLLKNGNLLAISYSATTINPANNLDGLGEWHDKSGNGNHAKFAFGNAPIRQDNQINGNTVVRFNNGTMLSTLTAPLTDKREMTVIAVIKSNFATSGSNGRVVTGMSSSGVNDTSGSGGIMPILRNAASSGFSSNYSGSGVAYRTDTTCGTACASRPYAISSSFGINSSNSILATLKGEGSTLQTKDNLSPPTGTPPYTYTIDQFYFGGRRNGAMVGGTGTDYLNGDYAEIIVYDKLLACREIESLEDYLRTKWGLAASPYVSTCPADTVPLL